MSNVCVVSSIPDDVSADTIIEEAVGLVALGLFREARTAGPQAAADTALAVVNTVRQMAFGFLQRSEKRKP